MCPESDIEFLIDSFAHTDSLASGLHYIWCKGSYLSFWGSLIYYEVFCFFLFVCFPFADPLSLTFCNFTRMYLGMDVFEFNLFGAYWASLISRLIFYIKFGKFSAITCSNVLSTPISLSQSLLWTFWLIWGWPVVL